MTAPHPSIRPQPGIMEISAYVPGASHAQGANRVYKLSSNENPFGPSPKAIDAFKAAGDSLALYPEGGSEELAAAIAGAHGLPANRIVCGSGSDELISLLCQAYAGPGDEVLQSEYGFLMYAIYARTAGATPVLAPERDLTADVDALLAAVTDRTRLVFLANPNSPTGTMVGADEVRRLAEGLPAHALLVLDAAYAEYVRREDYEAGAALVAERDNVAMLRTFSKIHGLAALRLGWLYGPDHVVDVLHRIRGPFNVNAAAQAAGAAAIQDAAYARDCALKNEVWRDWLTKRLTECGVGVVPSEGNFILARFEADGPRSASEADAFLTKRGVLVRQMGGYGLPDCLRITIGDEDGCQAVADAVAAFLADRG